jgi:probable rRNA maturation factor
MAAKNKLTLSVQYADPALKNRLTRSLIREWVTAALFAPAEITIRLVGKDEGRQLNRDYRGKDYATNVLTFSYNEGADTGHDVGPDAITKADIILCTDVLEHEAASQAKHIEAHGAHLIVHGVLHAQGYDHETEDEADEMEEIETEIMEALGFNDPYCD